MYLLLAFISTSVGVFFGWIEFTRAIFFYFKELEYFLMFFITVNSIKDYKDLKLAVYAFLISGLANGSYVLYQFFSGRLGGMVDPDSIYRYYSVSMIGESGPSVTGHYFSLLMFFSLTLLILIPGKTIKLISIICMSLSILGLIGSMSRTSIWGTVIVLPLYLYLLILWQKNRIKNIIVVFAILMFLFLIIKFSYYKIEESIPSMVRIIDIANLGEKYYTSRVEDVYADYFKVIPKSPVIGLGKSITGQQNIPGIKLSHFYGEAHNQYIRVLAEMGIIGLFAFLYLLFSVIKFSYRGFKDSFSYHDKCIGLTCFIYTLFLLVTFFGQDAFVTARTTELYWILVGLMMVACKWKRKKPSALTNKFVVIKSILQYTLMVLYF